MISNFKKFVLLFLVPTLYVNAQDITLTGGESITISNNTVFNINGLELIPSANYTLTSPNTISKSSTAIDPLSIDRVYNFDNLISNYQGRITLFYEDSELNGATESDLVLQIKDGASAWNKYSGTLDTTNNYLFYDFAAPINLISVTASNNITLNSDKSNLLAIKVYPNPTADYIIIDTKLSIETSIYNILGQEVITTNNKEIDLTKLNSGTYFLWLKDIASKNLNSYKIIKN
ncbi:T9SS type A sorting domain-containing protein [Pontimicrobium sp. SW4]|uniref:T9SS type A sorting domain-containing protein n=1 Tax=Pontimicrobium sp. SW4 TaxID=3153519 RepID=A0AAU7BXK6_9FLAO